MMNLTSTDNFSGVIHNFNLATNLHEGSEGESKSPSTNNPNADIWYVTNSSIPYYHDAIRGPGHLGSLVYMNYTYGHPLYGQDPMEILTIFKKHSLVSVSSGKYPVAKYRDDIPSDEWTQHVSWARGVCFYEGGMTLPLPKFFADTPGQLNVRLNLDREYKVYPKFDGTNIIIKNIGEEVIVHTLGSSNDSKGTPVWEVKKYLGDKLLDFPIEWTFIFEWVNCDTAHVERNPTTKLVLIYSYDTDGIGRFPEDINMHMPGNVECAICKTMTGQDIINHLIANDNRALANKDITQVQEGMVVWDKVGDHSYPIKIKSHLWRIISDIKRPHTFLPCDLHGELKGKFKGTIQDAIKSWGKYLNDHIGTTLSDDPNHDLIKSMMMVEFNQLLSKCRVQLASKKEKFDSVVASAASDVGFIVNPDQTFGDFCIAIRTVMRTYGKDLGPYKRKFPKKKFSQITADDFV